MEKPKLIHFNKVGSIIAPHGLPDYEEYSKAQSKYIEHLESKLEKLNNIGDRTMSLDTAMTTIKSLPYDQAKQMLKADLANKPDTEEIDGDILLVYFR